MSFATVRAPGSSANLGPGFDTLALAVPLHLWASARPAPRFSVELRGEGAGEVVDEDHVIHQLVVEVLGHDRVALRVESEIPLARGLGSSAALALAVAGALGYPDPLALALDVEGHPENVAASYYGGAVAALATPSGPIIRRLEVDPRLRLVVVVPRERLTTEAARRVLPEVVPFGDAVANLARAVLLARSLAQLEELVAELFVDRLHQEVRSELFPRAREILRALREAGCIGATWSGAGTSCVGFTHVDDAERVADVVRGLLPAEFVRVLAVDLDGMRQEPLQE
jgi:homoserine kinase